MCIRDRLYGRRGWITYRLLGLGWDPYNCWGVILMQSLSFVPLNALFLGGILENSIFYSTAFTFSGANPVLSVYTE